MKARRLRPEASQPLHYLIPDGSNFFHYPGPIRQTVGPHQNKKGAMSKQSASESCSSFTSFTSVTSSIHFLGLDSGGTNPFIR